MVYPRYGIKISDCGSVRSVYNSDYYTSLEGGRLPIRWMAWESVVLVDRFYISLYLAFDFYITNIMVGKAMDFF